MAPEPELQIELWKVKADVDATRAAYAASTAGADECGCSTCQSYASIRHVAIPPQVARLLESLGIDPLKEEEVIGGHPDVSAGLRFFSGWFHFIGEVLEGDHGGPPEFGGPGDMGMVTVSPTFSFFLSGHGAPPSFEAFTGKRIVVVEFFTKIPEGTPGFRRLVGSDYEELEPL